MRDTPAPTQALRILDANLNRAREALRVMEEYARFVLDDGILARAIKDARHGLAGLVPEGLAAALIRSRDIVGDVGRHTKTIAEGDRGDSAAVAVAAGKRLTEALRAIEEYGKTIDPAFGAHVERLRYNAYELERRIGITASARARFGFVRLYVIITESLCRAGWFATARAALEGGADCLQLREKELPDRVLIDRARRLAALCREQGSLFIVNDRPDIAAVCGADGVHLGQDDLSVAEARRVLGGSALVGVSTHTLEQFDVAVSAAPDYVAVGPMFATETKPQGIIAGPEMLRQVRSRTGLPIVAIGGINEQNASEVVAAARASLCVCRSVISSPDVGNACRRLRALIECGDGVPGVAGV